MRESANSDVYAFAASSAALSNQRNGVTVRANGFEVGFMWDGLLVFAPSGFCKESEPNLALRQR